MHRKQFLYDFVQALLDPPHNLRLIHRIDVDMPDTICDQVDDLIRRIDDPRLLHRLRIPAKAVHDAPKPHRHIAA